MFTKSCLTAGLALLLACPPMTQGQDMHRDFDQFSDAINSGIFQGLYLSGKLTFESTDDDRVTQGVNVIHGYTSGGEIMQEAIFDDDLTLKLSRGDDVVQAINVYRGGSAEKIEQVAVVNGTVRMSSQNQGNSIQGINVITGIDCD